MNWEEVIEAIAVGESSRLRFFGSLSDFEDLGSVMVGMANDSGGRIVVGLDLSNIHLCGSDLDQEWLRTFTAQHLSAPLPITLHTVPRGNRQLVVLEIEEGKHKPYYFNNMCFIMDGKVAKLSPLIKRSLSSPTPEPKTETPRTATPKPEVELPKPEKPTIMVYQATPLSSPTPEPKTKSTSQAQALNERQSQALEMIKRDGFIKNKRYRQLFNVSHKTAHLELVAMVAKGLIVSDGLGRNTQYIIPNK